MSKVRNYCQGGCKPKTRLSSLDCHSQCKKCRGRDCSFSDPCSECGNWSKKEWAIFIAREVRNAQKAACKRRQRSLSKDRDSSSSKGGSDPKLILSENMWRRKKGTSVNSKSSKTHNVTHNALSPIQSPEFDPNETPNQDNSGSGQSQPTNNDPPNPVDTGFVSFRSEVLNMIRTLNDNFVSVQSDF